MSNQIEKATVSASISKRDRALITIQAILKGVPFGESIEHFIFGPMDELRMQRIETTLAEVLEALRKRNSPSSVHSENFVNLLETVTPALSRATNEDRRQRFRDLLLNAAQIPPNDPKWEDAELAALLLEDIDAPGLAILAALAKCKTSQTLTLTSRPIPQIYEGEFDYENPDEPHHVISYDWIVVEEWARRLSEKRLIGYLSSDARGGFGTVYLSSLGRFLVNWTLSDKS